MFSQVSKVDEVNNVYLENIYKPLNAIISASSNWILMIYSSLDSSYQDESNNSKIILIGTIFIEIVIFAKISGWIGLGSQRIILTNNIVTLCKSNKII